MQGIALGGELPGAISFVSEQVSGKRVAFALGILASTVCLGSLGGSIVVSSLAKALGPEAMNEYGWRIPFLLGGVFELLSVYLRRFTHETPVFEAMKQRVMLSERAPFAVLVEGHRFNLFSGMVLAASTTIVAAATQQFPITLFVTMKDLPMAEVAGIQTMLIAFTMVGNVLGGLLVSWQVGSVRNTYIAVQLVTMCALFWGFGQDTVDGLFLPAIVLGICGGCAMDLSTTRRAAATHRSLRLATSVSGRCRSPATGWSGSRAYRTPSNRRARWLAPSPARAALPAKCRGSGRISMTASCRSRGCRSGPATRSCAARLRRASSRCTTCAGSA